MSSKRMGWILIAALAAVVVLSPAVWACDKAHAEGAQAKDGAKPCCAHAAEVAKNGAAAPVAAPAVNGTGNAVAPCAHGAGVTAAAVEPAVNAVANEVQAPCPHAAAMAAGAPCPMAGAKGQMPCAGKEGKPCAAKAAGTVAQADAPAADAKTASR